MSRGLSYTAENILKDGTAYSNCLYSNDFNMPLLDRLKFEILELGNMAIPYYCSILYDIETGATEIDTINNICKYFVDKFNTKELYCTWVTSQWALKDFGPAKDESYQVFMPKRVAVVTDLSTDGVLVVSPEKFTIQKYVKTYTYYPGYYGSGYNQKWESEYYD